MAHLLPKSVLLTEGSSIPGALEGWLDPAGAWEGQNIRLKKMLYDKGWIRIIIQHDNNLIYFESDELPWQQFTSGQKRWLKDAALRGVKKQTAV